MSQQSSQIRAAFSNTQRDGQVIGGMLAYREDNGATYNYYGISSPGASENDPIWAIARETVSSSAIQWADGNNDFDNIWANRASLSYS